VTILNQFYHFGLKIHSVDKMISAEVIKGWRAKRSPLPMLVVALRDITRPDSAEQDTASAKSSRIIVDREEDDDDNGGGNGEDGRPDGRSTGMRKVVLADAADQLMVAVEHQAGSLPLGLRVGSQVTVDPSCILWVRDYAFLKQGAVVLSSGSFNN
jgi:hypothetical protein